MNNQECQISLRLPRNLKEQLELRAEHNWRSLNGEILAMLEDCQKNTGAEKFMNICSLSFSSWSNHVFF
jgi:hypothetical protein